MNCQNCRNEIEDFAICSDCEIELRRLADRTPVELAAEDLLKACEAIVRDYEDEDSNMIIDPASCVHIPNHTDLCPYWLAKQAIQKAKFPNNRSVLKSPSGPDEYKSSQ